MSKPLGGLFVSLLLLLAGQAYAQNYHAFNGSSYTGVAAMYNNPASTVNQVYKWDVQLFGLQTTISNKTFLLNNTSLLPNSDSKISVLSGLRPRYFHTTADVNLLNLRYSINPKNAIAIGLRARAYAHANAQPFNYNDTISSLNSFFHANNHVNFLDAYATHAGWAQLSFNYSRVIMQSPTSSLSAGITLNYIKSVSGAYGILSRINYSEEKKAGGDYKYTIHDAAVALAVNEPCMGLNLLRPISIMLTPIFQS